MRIISAKRILKIIKRGVVMTNKKKNFMADVIDFFTHKLWEIDTTELTKIRKNVFLFFRWVYLIGYGFIKDKCLLRASALTYTTTLSIVPFLAVAFSIAKGFGFQNTDYIRSFLLKLSAGREGVADTIIQYVNRTDVTTLGTVGILTLLLTVISLLSTIEKSFNVIWGIKQPRSFGRKFTDYLSTTLIFPLLMIVATSVTASLKSNSLIQKILGISFVGKSIVFLMPFITMGFALTFVYSFMPNTKVKFTAAMGGGFIGGALWIVTQWIYITFQIGVSKYNKIYGSFAQLPLFLFWLYISWALILLGAEIAFAFQNLKTFQKEALFDKISFKNKEKIALRLMYFLAENFNSGMSAVSNERIAEELNAPVRIVNDILNILESKSLVLKVNKDKDEYFAIAKPLEKINVSDIVNALKEYKEFDFKLAAKKKFQHLDLIINRIEKDFIVRTKNYNLKNLIKKA